MSVIWFAGGCFWGTEHVFKAVKGVTSTEVGYANGNISITPTYELVCKRIGGYRETVQVTYDPNEVSLDFLLYAFYATIDPTMKDRQGNDYGPQYQACIFWNDSESEAVVRRISEIESKRYQPFNVILEELTVFVPAEEYHQDYIEKNDGGYCHIEPEVCRMIADRKFDPAEYRRPSDEELLEILTLNEYGVTQECGTEPPYVNEYYKEFRPGIYVDKVSGEPLFLSTDKYDTNCGWPAFSDVIDENAFIYFAKGDFGEIIKEIKTRVGNTHLGHLFYCDKTSPSGRRFCIDSLSLTFIPLEEMDERGYGRFKQLLVSEIDNEKK